MESVLGRLVPPSPDLRPWIRYYAVCAAGRVPIGPSRFAAQPGAALHFAIGDGGLTSGNNEAIGVSGPSDGPLVAPSMPRGDAIIVAFRAGAWNAFAGVPAAELKGQAVEVGVVWRLEVQRVLDQLRVAHLSRRIRQIEALLRLRLRQAADRRRGGMPTPTVQWLRDAMYAHPPAACAAAMGLSLRQFQRRFLLQFGMTPKRYQRQARFYRAVAHLQQLEIHPDPSLAALADLAAVHGYYDQSHLVRDFKAFTGFSPLELGRRVNGGDPAMWPYSLRGAPIAP